MPGIPAHRFAAAWRAGTLALLDGRGGRTQTITFTLAQRASVRSTNVASLRLWWSVRSAVNGGEGERLHAVRSRHQVPALDSDSYLKPVAGLWVGSSLRGWPSLPLRLTADRSSAHAAPPCDAARLQPTEMSHSLTVC